MRALWMPYVSFVANGARNGRMKIAHAELWPDIDESWRNALDQDRPTWLSGFRSFPRRGETALGEPCRGTLIVSADENWLREHAFRLIGVLYLLGDHGPHGAPAERFKYIEIRISGTGHDLVQMWTKKGPLTEDADSLAVSPPIELRGRSDQYCLDNSTAAHDTLISLLTKSPSHRLVTACYHYFMAQFGDVFHSPWPQDYSHYCSCLEAAFDIDPFSGKLHNSLANELETVYGTDPKLREWAVGLYSVRSVYNHGSDGKVASGAMAHLGDAQDAFLARKGNATVSRSVCRDILRRALAAYGGGESSAWSLDRADDVLRACLHSDNCWQSVKKLTHAKGSVERAAKATGSALEQLDQMLQELATSFDWQFTVALPDSSDVWEAIGVFSHAATKVSSSNADVRAEARELVGFASGQRVDEIKEWLVRKHPVKTECAGGTSLEELLLLLAVEVARFFSHYS